MGDEGGRSSNIKKNRPSTGAVQQHEEDEEKLRRVIAGELTLTETAARVSPGRDTHSICKINRHAEGRGAGAVDADLGLHRSR